MRSYYIILFLSLSVVVAACNRSQSKPINSKLAGSWVLDSIAGSFNKWEKDFVFITNDQKFWRLTYWNDRYLIDSSLSIEGEVVQKGGRKFYTLKTMDSTGFVLHDQSGNKFFYRASSIESLSYQQQLSDFLKADSLKQVLQGSWKLTHSTLRPIKFISYHVPLYDFTLQLDGDGEAVVYINNKRDSIVEYRWGANINGILFFRGDVGSTAFLHYLDDSTLKVSVDRWAMDTITLQRTTSLSK